MLYIPDAAAGGNNAGLPVPRNIIGRSVSMSRRKELNIRWPASWSIECFFTAAYAKNL